MALHKWETTHEGTMKNLQYKVARVVCGKTKGTTYEKRHEKPKTPKHELSSCPAGKRGKDRGRQGRGVEDKQAHKQTRERGG